MNNTVKVTHPRNWYGGTIFHRGENTKFCTSSHEITRHAIVVDGKEVLLYPNGMTLSQVVNIIRNLDLPEEQNEETKDRSDGLSDEGRDQSEEGD
jgi:hypothetical protein